MRAVPARRVVTRVRFIVPPFVWRLGRCLTCCLTTALALQIFAFAVIGSRSAANSEDELGAYDRCAVPHASGTAEAGADDPRIATRLETESAATVRPGSRDDKPRLGRASLEDPPAAAGELNSVKGRLRLTNPPKRPHARRDPTSCRWWRREAVPGSPRRSVSWSRDGPATLACET